MKLTKAYFSPIILSLIVVLMVSLEVTAQNEVAIGSSTTKSNAILWLNGNGSQGLILPVVTNKSAVSGPDKGMVVFDDSDGKVWYRNGSTWVEVGGGSGSTTNLNLSLQGNQLQLKDATSVLSSVNLATGTQGNGAFMVFQGGAWQYATLSGDVTGLNGALQVGGMKGKTMASLPSSTQVLAYDPAANSGNGGWVFQSPTGVGSVTSVTGTAPVTVTNGTTTPTIAIAIGGITNALLANNAVTSAKIQDATIADIDIADAAAIAVSKLSKGADGQVLTTVAGTPSWSAGSTGTVTSVTAGTGLTGGPITTTGALSVDVGTTANKIVQLDGTGRLPAIDGSQLTNIPVGTVADGSITGGTAGAGVKIAAGTITNANISGSANIAATKLASTVVLDTEAPNAAGDINGDFSSGLQIKTG
ncbi:MAG: hypothetical protein OEV74_19005, partial [Cyclobacteriaceae bacterium]|nr:hypothetical protein [Cyclobacteriaceae bacterium]